MESTELKDYLADDEELLLSFPVENIQMETQDALNEMLRDSMNDRHQFGATDRRIVYITKSGTFKDIDFSQITSIETQMRQNNSGNIASLATGCCGGVLALGGIASVPDDPDVALFGLLIGGGILAVAVSLYQKSETTENQHISLDTGNDFLSGLGTVRITLPSETERDIGAELSRILRENRNE